MDCYEHQLLEQVSNLRIGGSADKPRLHKPLLVLLLLSKFERTGCTRVSFIDIEEDLTRLIEKYAPSASGARPVYPFWRLQTDGFWQIGNAAEVELNGSGDPSPKSLTHHHRGGWTAAALSRLRQGNVEELVDAVLSPYFEPADHDRHREDLGLANFT